MTDLTSNWDDDDFDATAAFAAHVSASNVSTASFSAGRETSAQYKGRKVKGEKALEVQQLAEKLFGLSVDYAPSRTREVYSNGSEDELGKLLGPSFRPLVFDASTGKEDLRLLAENIGAQFNRRSSHRMYTTFTMQLTRALCEQMSKGELELVWGDIDAAVAKKSAQVNGGVLVVPVSEIEKTSLLDAITNKTLGLRIDPFPVTTIGRTVLPGTPAVTLAGPYEVGQFECSSDGNGEEIVVHFDNIKYPYLCEDLRRDRHLNIDLMRGLRTYVRKDHRKTQLGERIVWLERQLQTQPGISLKQVVHNSDFFSGRGALLAAGCTPSDAEPWKLVAFKFHDVIFLTRVEPDIRDEEDLLADYIGHHFERCVTSSSPFTQGRPDVTEPVNSHEKFMVMSKGSLSLDCRHTTFMYSAEVDCIGRDGHYIELKTEVENVAVSPRLASKYAKWWLQCKLAKVSEIVVGVKEKPRRSPPTKVKFLKSVDVSSLPRLAHCQRHWRPNDMLSYLHHFLDRVKGILDLREDSSILTAELKAGRAESVEIRVQPLRASKYRVLYDELEERLSPLLV